jgi:hypothetical protein
MRVSLGLSLLVLLACGAAGAQEAPAFIDVPPWHWAYDSVQRSAAAGVFRGYPTTDSERIANTVTQIYEAFAHATHTAAREWAERFAMNLPPDWPAPLQRSRLQNFRLENIAVSVAGNRATAAFVAAITLTSTGGGVSVRSSARAELTRTGEGRWRANYATLAAAQPQLFR